MLNPHSNPTIFTILVHGKPCYSESHQSAQQFIDAVYQSSNSVAQVFFYGEATSICGALNNHSNLLQEPQQELQQHWLALSQKYNFPLHACITTAIRRGIIDSEASMETSKKVNLLNGFKLEGLGILAESLSLHHKMIEFGA